MHCPTLHELPPASPSRRTGWPWTEESEQLPATMPNGKSWPRISIVTPSYNQGQFIEETIRSVLLQGYPNLEYIMMDGGSTDRSVEIIRKYEPWLAYWVSKPDDGQSAAIGEGFNRSTGNILAWINSDDRYLTGTFARVARFFTTRPKVAFGCGDINSIDVEGAFIKRAYVVRPWPFITANTGWHRWFQQGSFWRRDIYEKVGGVDVSLQFCMDTELFIRLTRAGIGRRIPGPPLAEFRSHEAAKTSILLDVYAQETALLIKRYGNPKWISHPRLLMLLWQLWNKPLGLRKRVIRWLGWEY